MIATGFDSENDDNVIKPDFPRRRISPVQEINPAQETSQPVTEVDQPVLKPSVPTVPFELSDKRVTVGGGASDPVLPLTRFPERMVSREQIEGLDIPTFIRRQMD